ncbi:MAG: aminotransferase class IV [Saprospiraceae bacterium]
MSVNYNGRLTEALPAELADLQRAWSYGDFLFESIRVFDGRIPLMNRHWDRLNIGLKALGYHIPGHWSDIFFAGEIARVAPPNARVRLTVWRSPGGLYRPTDHAPCFLIQATPLSSDRYEWPEEGLRVGVCTNLRIAADAYSGFKALNAPRYVAAAVEAARKGWDEALLLNTEGRIAESERGNLFWVERGRAFTPPLSDGCVTGVMRNLLLTLIPDIQERSLTPTALACADEVFLSNAVQGLRPVRYFEEKEYGHVVTRSLFERVAAHLDDV